MESTTPLTATATVAARVRELRGQRQWSAQRLVDELRKTGIEWNRGVVAKLETGRRESVSVAELLGLAEIFDVPPMSLVDDGENDLDVARKLLNEAGLMIATTGGGDDFLGRLYASGLLTEDQEAMNRVVRMGVMTVSHVRPRPAQDEAQ